MRLWILEGSYEINYKLYCRFYKYNYTYTKVDDLKGNELNL